MRLIAAPLTATARQGVGVGIGIVTSGSLPSEPLIGALEQRLHAQVVEDQNLLGEFRTDEGRLERLLNLAAELVRLKIDPIRAPTPAAS